ncbi:kelch-like protein 17 [Solanum pennellii]|uniref:Kelch-like protein 17 n=1 Tax=Solanum pennellii TaxID=28526 RepID=A0ABM1UWW0_SOLPN|nr:kelch-like protein 17 [Solanum pennellii]
MGDDHSVSLLINTLRIIVITFLQTAERFDPRERSWATIRSMSTRRGCHTLTVLDGKLYAVDGATMVRSTEIYDPRLATWMVGEPMELARGYSAAAVLQDSIYEIGGVKSNEKIVDVIECYKPGVGWKTLNLKGVGRRTAYSHSSFDR